MLPDRASIVQDTLIEGVPSLLVEVASRSSRLVDQGPKRRVYGRHEVPEYWYVEPAARAITRLTEPTSDGYARSQRETSHARSTTIPGVAFDLNERFWS